MGIFSLNILITHNSKINIMKKLSNKVSMFIIGIMSIVLMLSCQNDDNMEINKEIEQIDYEESPVISFDEIEKLTQNIVDGELPISEDNTTTSKSTINISREKRVFDFSATINSGASQGTVLSGELKLNYTLYHASFAIVRGKLTFPDNTKASVRGAVICDGIVYLIIDPPGSGLIFGVGKTDEAGNLEGSFRIFGSDSGKGNWKAELTKVVYPDKTIVELIVEDGRFTTLVGALQAVELVDALSQEGPFTVFAPTDTAFSALDEIPGADALKEILLYHVASGRLNTAKLLEQELTKTLQGENVKVSFDGSNEIVINDTVKLLSSNIGGSNGVIHVINAVLIPPSFEPEKSILEIALETPELSTLVGAVQSVGLVDALSGVGPFTVFAPTNEAFSALDEIPDGDALKEVLLYHVVSGKYTAEDLLEKQVVTTLQGENVTIEMIGNEVILNDNVKVIIDNIEASNGIIHVISGVLLPPTPLQSIVDIAIATPELSTLVSALQSAELVDALSGIGPFTVFAPTNTAFESLDSIPQGDALKEVLLYHVAMGKYKAEDLLIKQKVVTLQGEEVTVEMINGKVFLNGNIEVEIADIEASNGIVHVIKGVLIPSTCSF